MGANVRILSLGLSLPQRDLLSRGNNYCRGRPPPPAHPSQSVHTQTRRSTVHPKREKEERVLATLSVLKFNDPSGADRVLLALQGMQERQLIRLEDAALVSWKTARSPRSASSLA
jgi:hypothetical protein